MESRPKATRAVALAGLAILVTFVAVLLGRAAAPAQAGSPEDAVLDWNQYAVEALVNVPNGPVPNAGQGPTVAILHLAMVQGAVYDAVNMIDGGHEAYLDNLPSAPASASMPAAVATAAHHVLVGMVVMPPLAVGVVDRLERALCRLARGDPERCREDRWDRGRGGCRGGDAHRAEERRPVRAVPIQLRRGRRGVAAGHRHDLHHSVRPERPERLGGAGRAVRAREHVAVPLEGAARAQEWRIRKGVRRGEEPRGL